MRKVRSLLQEKTYDIIWFNNVIIGYLSSKCNSSVIHVGMVNDYTSVIATLKNFKLDYRWVRHFLFRQVEKRACVSFRKVITNSTYLTNVLVKNYKISRNKTNKTE